MYVSGRPAAHFLPVPANQVSALFTPADELGPIFDFAACAMGVAELEPVPWAHCFGLCWHMCCSRKVGTNAK